jgi:hypothetical protein
MEIVFTVLKILLGAILLIVGIGSRKAYKSTGMELRLSGDKYYAPGFKLRRFFLFLSGYLFILLSIYIFYTVIFD